MKITDVKKTLYKGNIYIFETPKGYLFKKDGTNYGTMIYAEKLPNGITLEKDEVNFKENSK